MNVKVIPKSACKLLPPRADVCQVCATDHPPELPHNAQSLYYQMKFQIEHDRDATWLDAMAHCSPEVQDDWRACLLKLGVDIDAGQITPVKPTAGAKTAGGATAGGSL